MDDKLKIIKALIKGSKFVIKGQQPDFERVETVQHVALTEPSHRPNFDYSPTPLRPVRLSNGQNETPLIRPFTV
jgi:hypothetical protein